MKALGQETVPNLMNITEGTKYEDEQLRESVVNIDKIRGF
jgi:hypothetical protein